MNTKELEQLKKDGFCGFKTVAELRKNINIVPELTGVYVLLRPNDDEPVFLEKGTGGFFKKKNPNVAFPKLGAKWVRDTSIVYIGKADISPKTGERGLRTRLKEYLDFGQGQNIGHWGGRYVWQLKDSAELVVCWKRVDSNAEQVEKQMIITFHAKHGKYPFANLRL